MMMLRCRQVLGRWWWIMAPSMLTRRRVPGTTTRTDLEQPAPGEAQAPALTPGAASLRCTAPGATALSRTVPCQECSVLIQTPSGCCSQQQAGRRCATPIRLRTPRSLLGSAGPGMRAPDHRVVQKLLPRSAGKCWTATILLGSRTSVPGMIFHRRSGPA